MLEPLPLRAEPLYVGIDIGKFSHVAGFLSSFLLTRYERFELCPTLSFEQSRTGFDQLATRIRSFGPLASCIVLVEHTGHYGNALVQYLQEQGVTVYFTHVRERTSRHKSDSRDALVLANVLYNQLEKSIQVASLERIHSVVPPSASAAQLRGLMRHRYELVHETTQRKNKLRAIADELFPELFTLFKDPNCDAALRLRETFATPQALIDAAPEQLDAIRVKGRRPSLDALIALQAAATTSIGTRDTARTASLTFEQKQLIKELKLLQDHLQELDTEITTILASSREGRILASFPILGIVQSASLLAAIGSIGNFASAGALKSYLGWSPQKVQTGVSLDFEHLSKAGNKTMKQMLYLVALHAVQLDTEWKSLYERLVPRKCAYDARRKVYIGRKKVLGRICGSIITVVYALLRQDYDLLAALSPDETPPAPMLYDRSVHRAHRTGGRSQSNQESPPS